MRRPFFTPGKDQVPIVQESGLAPGPVWTGDENLASTGIRSPERPALSQSLYRLSYPTHNRSKTLTNSAESLPTVIWTRRQRSIYRWSTFFLIKKKKRVNFPICNGNESKRRTRRKTVFILCGKGSTDAADPRLRNSGVIQTYGVFSPWWSTTVQFCTTTWHT